MLAFNTRAQSFESHHANEQEWQFLVNVRRNKLLGYWAGGILKHQGQELETYARAVVISDFERPGDEDVLDKVHDDLINAGSALSRAEVRRIMDHLMIVARHEILSDQQYGEYSQELLMSYA